MVTNPETVLAVIHPLEFVAEGGGGSQLVYSGGNQEQGGNAYGSTTATVYTGGTKIETKTGTNWFYAGGGGAGSGGNGGNGNGNNNVANGGAGGVGVSNSFRTGSPLFYSGGGGGSGGSGVPSLIGPQGAGGSGVGGDGVAGTTTGNNGTTNTGGGGGGSWSGNAGSGGSGIVVVRYPASAPMATGGTITSYTSGSTTYQVHTFTSSETFSLAASTPPLSLTSTGVATTVCTANTETTLDYSASTGNPTSYSIDWSAAAIAAGLSNQLSTNYTFAAGGGTIAGIVIPASVPAGTY